MCGSALVRWGVCGASHGTSPRFHTGRTCSEIVGNFLWEQVCELKSSSVASPSLCTPHGLRVAISVPVLFPCLLLLLGCILPQCEFRKSAKHFSGLLGRYVNPRAGPAFPAGSTSLQLPALPAPAPALLPMALSPPHQPSTSKLHTHPRQSVLVCFYYWVSAFSEKRWFRK